tara:strand:- start:4589 stop:4849 length:261 start_codon:yes stop_codon:yes gene_type:complete
MPSYNPPIAHYSQINVSEFAIETILAAIGKKGQGFINQTNKLGLDYLWWDSERKVVEIWGSFQAVKNAPIQLLDFIKTTGLKISIL